MNGLYQMLAIFRNLHVIDDFMSADASWLPCKLPYNRITYNEEIKRAEIMTLELLNFRAWCVHLDFYNSPHDFDFKQPLTLSQKTNFTLPNLESLWTTISNLMKMTESSPNR